MGKSSPSPPPAPAAPTPPSAAEQAKVNRITQFTPQGNLIFGKVTPSGTFELDPEKSEAALRVDETPFQAAARQAQEATALQLATALGPQAGDLQPISTSGLPNIPRGIDLTGLPSLASDVSRDRGRVEQATFQRALNLLRPEYQRQEGQLVQRLADQGIPLSAEAASGEFGDLTRFERGRNEALTNLALEAVLAGGGEQTRQQQLAGAIRGQGVNEQLQQAQLQLSGRQTALGEQQAIRGQQLQELASLIGGQAFNPTPTGQFFAPGQIDLLGPAALQQQAQLANYNARAQQAAAGNAGLAGLGAAGIGTAGLLGAALISSRKFKHKNRPVEHILPRIAELKVEAWEYKPGYGDGQAHIGPYAEDFRRLFGVGNGWTINMVDAFGVCLLGIKELIKRTDFLEHQIARLPDPA